MPFDKIKENLQKELEKKEKIEKEVVSYADFIVKELPPNKWVLDMLIPEGMTILSSAPGQFKTFLLLALCKQISKGEMGFNNFESKKRNILFINEEMGQRAMQDRLKIIEGEAGNIYFTNLAEIKIDDAKIVLEVCKKREIDLVIFDSLTRIHGLSENDADSVKKIFESLLVLMRENISVILTHHHRKAPLFGKSNGSDEMRGSTDLLAQVDCHLAIDTVAVDKSYIIMRQLKLRQAENMQDFRVDIVKNKETGKISFQHRGQFSKIDEHNLKVDECKNIVLDVIRNEEGITKNEIIKALEGKVGQRIIGSILPGLEGEKIIYAVGKKPKKYFLMQEINGLL